MTRFGILVGVTGPGENGGALRWAADEADRRHSHVTLVHAINPLLTAPPPSVLMLREPMIESGRSLLQDVSDEYTRVTGRHCDTRVVEGPSANVLTDMSEHAELVVLAHRRLSALRRIMTWSTTVSVAAHSRCPVVAVPPDWTREPSTGERWVTVGVHETGVQEPVLQAGFDAAQALGTGVRLLHAWRPEPLYDDIVMRRIDPEWHDRIASQISAGAEPFRAKYPDVALEIDVEHEWPADALIQQGRASALLVVGRHSHIRHLPSRIGSIARTALSGFTCPVMVVPV